MFVPLLKKAGWKPAASESSKECLNILCSILNLLHLPLPLSTLERAEIKLRYRDAQYRDMQQNIDRNSLRRSSPRLCQDMGQRPAIPGHRRIFQIHSDQLNLTSARIRTITEMSELGSNEHAPLSPRLYQTDAKIAAPPDDNRQDREQRNDKSGNVDSRGADHQLLSRLQLAADRSYQHRR